MEKLQKFSLSFLVCVVGFLSSCNSPAIKLSNHETDTLVKRKFDSAWHLYQGSPKNMNLLEEIVELDPEQYEAWRELSIPYLKRGYPHLWFSNYQKVIEHGGTIWIGARGTDYFYFYRDYKRALQDFDALDTLTPNQTDYPQATSDLYFRALCYYGLRDYDQALTFLQRHIDEQSNSTGGFNFLDPHVFLYQGLIYYKTGKTNEALHSFETGLTLFDKSSDLHFQMAKTYLVMNDSISARKSLHKAQEYFRQGYYNQHNYVEVQDQIYRFDLDSLDKILN